MTYKPLMDHGHTYRGEGTIGLKEGQRYSDIYEDLFC